MILADTSAWVEFDRRTESSVDLRMTELIGGAADLVVTDPVIMEVVNGATTDRRETDLRRLLGRFRLMRFDVGSDFDRASAIYRRCRRSGFTPRGTVDCLIAAVAWRCEAVLLAADADIVRIAEVIGLPLDPASQRPA